MLGIETSCDETSVAIVSSDYQILANVVLSQEDHAAYGGVVPELASRAHIRTLCFICRQALERAGLTWNELAGIAVTHGPGLVGSLVVGLSTAKGLALSTGLPLIGVHHMEAHLFANRLTGPIPCPFVALLVSGGHTELILVPRWGKYELLGRTRDDAAVEAFDKTAKLLNLIPGKGVVAGGRMLAQCAANGNSHAVQFPRALQGQPNCDFSFSGLKTAVLNHVRSLSQRALSEQLEDIAASVQAAIVGALVDKTVYAVQVTGVQHVALAGGVAANAMLRQELEVNVRKQGCTMYCPPPALCTDNAAMVAAAGCFHLEQGETADMDLDAFPRISLA